MADPATAPPTTPAPAAAAADWGDPLSLGLASFGISALVLGAVNSGWVDASATPGVLSLAIALGFLTEIVAGVISFKRGETFAGTVFVSYAGFWLSYALLVWIFLPQVVAANGPVGDLVGWFLLAWSVFTTYMLLASLRTTRTITGIFALLTVTFWLLTIGTFTTSTTLSHLSGYVLVVDALLALFLSAAAIVNDTWGRTVIPAP
jgi:succinate-acetate transporter protein